MIEKFSRDGINVEAVEYTYHNLDEVISFGCGTVRYFKPFDAILLYNGVESTLLKSMDFLAKTKSGIYFVIKREEIVTWTRSAR